MRSLLEEFEVMRENKVYEKFKEEKQKCFDMLRIYGVSHGPASYIQSLITREVAREADVQHGIQYRKDHWIALTLIDMISKCLSINRIL